MIVFEAYLANPFLHATNLNVANWYFSQEQYSPAAGFYLRAAENSSDIAEQYRALLFVYVCLNRLGGRIYSERSVLKTCLELDPNRREAYYFLSLSYSCTNSWQDSYLFASLGLQKTESSPLLDEYPGEYGLLFQKGLAGYNLNKWQECRFIFHDLVADYAEKMDTQHYEKSLHNLRHLGSGPPNVSMSFYDSKNHELRPEVKFPRSENIIKNYAQVYQDICALALKNGKPGTYLEIGAADPEWGSNTALLEQFGWEGVGIEINKDFCEKHKKSWRQNPVFCQDAKRINYKKLLKEHFKENKIDYLQLDCEPPSATFEILLSLPLDEFTFGFITFEHDYFIDETKSYRKKSRRYLRSYGYELLINDVGPTDWYNFEDWWVKPGYFSSEIVKKLRSISKNNAPQKAKDLFVVDRV